MCQALLTGSIAYKLVVFYLYILRLSNPIDYINYTVSFVFRILPIFMDTLIKMPIDMAIKVLANAYSNVYPAYLIDFYYVVDNYATDFYIVFFFLHVALVITVLIVYRSYIAYRHPMRILLQGINYKPLKDEDKVGLLELTKRLSDKVKVKTPELLVTDSNEINVLSASKSQRERIILISEQVLNSLDLDEHEAVLAHELWHIKVDIEEVTRSSISFSKYLAYPQGVLGLMLASFTLFFLRPIEFTIVMDFLLFTFLYFAIFLSVNFFERKAFFGSFFNELREFDADCASALTTRKPRNMISAMRSLILLKVQRSVKTSALALYFHNPLAKEKNETRGWSGVVQPIWRPVWWYQHPSLADRIRLLRLMDKMLHDGIQIELRPTDLSPLRIFWPNILLLWSPFGKRLREMSNGEIARIYRYMRTNTEYFNLEICSKELEISENRVLTVFISFLMRNVLVIKRPLLR